jgi:hypothetical protein
MTVIQGAQATQVPSAHACDAIQTERGPQSLIQLQVGSCPSQYGLDNPTATGIVDRRQYQRLGGVMVVSCNKIYRFSRPPLPSTGTPWASLIWQVPPRVRVGPFHHLTFTSILWVTACLSCRLIMLTRNKMMKCRRMMWIN